MLEQYGQIMGLLRDQNVNWRKSEDRNEWRTRLKPAVRATWQQSSFSWKLAAPRPPAADARPLMIDELKYRPILTEPVVLSESRLDVILSKATTRLGSQAQRASVRSRLAY